jgi:hypothetical protein
LNTVLAGGGVHFRPEVLRALVEERLLDFSFDVADRDAFTPVTHTVERGHALAETAYTSIENRTGPATLIPTPCVRMVAGGVRAAARLRQRR